MLPGSGGIRAIAEMAPPATFTGIRRFLGASGYFRRFIKNYARIAKPLNDLLGCENSKLKLQPVTLGPEALEAFGKLKLKCITAPVLAFADFNKPFLLETDASGDGLGAVLSQKLEDNKFHPVAYASWGLKGSESNYHSSKLEFLALKWAVTDQFKEYLQYCPFTVKTDNNPLTYILTTPNLDATGHRAYKIADKTALSTAKCLYDNYFRHFGFPQCLMSDQGKEFCNSIIESLCIYLGIKKIRTTAYHPQSNGAVEWSHQTLQRMLGKLEGTKRKHWPEYLASVTLAYNATRSQVTGFSPYFLMFGRRPRLPVDLQFPTLRELPEPQGVHDYVNALYGRLREAIKLARDSAAEDAARHKRLYDRRAGTVQLHPGDKVLVRLDAYRGQRRKLVNRWGADLHTVVKRMAEDFPTYAVRNDRTKKETVLHRARLLLWAAVEESGNGVHLTAAQLGIRIARLDLSHKPDGGEVMQVPHEWTIVGIGLNLVKSKPSNEDSEPETGPLALATPAETLPKEEADRRMDSGEETISTASDTNAGSEDALSP